LPIQRWVYVSATHQDQSIKPRHQFVGIFVGQLLWHHNRWLATCSQHCIRIYVTREVHCTARNAAGRANSSGNSDDWFHALQATERFLNRCLVACEALNVQKVLRSPSRTLVHQQIITPDKWHLRPVNINYPSVRPSIFKLDTTN
jgi:hypothetical protein